MTSAECRPPSAVALAPVAGPAAMMRNGRYRDRAIRHLVEHRVWESSQAAMAITFRVRRSGQGCLCDPINQVQNFGAKGIGHQCVALPVPAKGIADVALRARCEDNGKPAHRALRRARASDHGTACTVPARSSLLRRQISSAQALATMASGSPSRLSSKATTMAERSSGASASASSIRWSMRADMRQSLAAEAACVAISRLRA